MTLSSLLISYFRQKGRGGGHAMVYRDPALKTVLRAGAKEAPIIRMVDVENCFGAFGDYAHTVERVLELRLLHELSPTAIAGRARRENLHWSCRLSRRNMVRELGVMETGLEQEAQRRGLIG